jgi:hypothetical protein
LSVHERNGRTQAFYRRYDFAGTGETIPRVDGSAASAMTRYEG